jgi:hypothetical protein
VKGGLDTTATVDVVVIEGTVAADLVQRRMPSDGEVTRASTLRSEAVPSPLNFAVFGLSRPAFSRVSSAFRRFWLAAKRSGVRIPTGPLAVGSWLGLGAVRGPRRDGILLSFGSCPTGKRSMGGPYR